MSDYYGDIRLGDTIDIKFTTRQISGAPFTLAGSPVISAYPGNSTTELTGGIVLTADFDGRTGYNNVRVVATSGNSYATATNYDLVITTGTVNSVSVVGESVGAFSIENRSALMPATAARMLVVDAAGLADANAVKLGPSGSGTALTARDVGLSVLLSNGTATGQIVLSSGQVTVGTNNDKTGYALTQSFPTNFSSMAITAGGIVKADLQTILTTALTETSAGYLAAGFKKVFDVAVPVFTAASVNQTGDSFARLGAPAGVSMSADVAAIKAETASIQSDTNDIQARLPAALTGAGNLKVDVLAINGDAAAAAVLAILNGATVVYQGTVTGAATTTTLIDSGLTQADADWWKGRIIIFTSVITLQATDITAFDPATDKLTFTACTQAPTGATYVII